MVGLEMDHLDCVSLNQKEHILRKKILVDIIKLLNREIGTPKQYFDGTIQHLVI